MHIITNRILIVLILGLGCLAGVFAQGQYPMSELSLEDLSAFADPPANWQIVGSASSSINENQELKTTKGNGILANVPDKKSKGQIYTNFQHGDLDLDLEVMMPKGSNSGIYLQGRYEIQLLDSWGKKRAGFGDIGGIYQRWDESKPEGKKGYEGKAPLANAAKAPGLWQRIRISFQAPRFNDKGEKIENARIIFVELNGVLVQQNVELSGPTRGPYVGGGDEAPFGPLVIQGDHGPVAFRNFKYRNYDGQPIKFDRLDYKVWHKSPRKIEDFDKEPPTLTGSDRLVSWSAARVDNNFTILYDGTLEVPEAGDYIFEIFAYGIAQFSINGGPMESMRPDYYILTKTLPAGKVPFKLLYGKQESWQQPQLRFKVEGAKFRPINLHYESSGILGSPADPIYETVGNEPRLLRSFVDFQLPYMEEPRRFTNTINVGDPTGVHYTYDLKQGSVVQIWRGDFLDMTPMWYSRGNGISRARGVVAPLTEDAQILQVNADGTLEDQYPDDKYHFHRYQLDEDGRPSFHYLAYGLEVQDRLMPSLDKKSLVRQLSWDKPAAGNLSFCLAKGEKITKLKDGSYLIDDNYYVSTSAKAKVESSGELSVLLVPMSTASTLEYTLIW